MSRLPDYEPSLVPEGNYRFYVTEEPEVRKKTNDETGRVTKRVIFSLQVEGESIILLQSFFPWTDTYKELAIAFGAPEDEKGKIHMSQIDRFTGLDFRADIVHEKGEGQNRDKTFMRVVNVRSISAAREEEPPVPSDPGDDGGDAPF